MGGRNCNGYTEPERERRRRSAENYSCREMFCIVLLPCLLLALILLAISNLATYFTVSQDMQNKMDVLRKELEDQRGRDGGVFMSLERKEELEKNTTELERLRDEVAHMAGKVVLLGQRCSDMRPSNDEPVRMNQTFATNTVKDQETADDRVKQVINVPMEFANLTHTSNGSVCVDHDPD